MPSVRNCTAAACGAILLCVATWALGNGPTEEYSVAFEEIAPSVLRDAMGVLTVTGMSAAGIGGQEPGFREHRPGSPLPAVGGWTSARQTTPLSNFGIFHPSRHGRDDPDYQVQAFRYPITDARERYLEIVVDPRVDRRIWVERSELGDQFRTRIDMLEDLAVACRERSDLHVNISSFTTSGRRKVYVAPRRDAESSVLDCRNPPRLARRSHGEGLFKALDVRGEFVQVGWAAYAGAGGAGMPEPIGWVRLRANSGELLLWIEQIDNG